jgi:sulfatase maturation enzyme AslB (radical SAM superfamily)
MISNGILFNEKNIVKARELWHLKNVQITLDGTESSYEQIKQVPAGSF